MRAGFVSRGTASTVVPFSPETIGRHERGDVEMEPEDALVYAECYQSPDILPRYCATCPVGRAIGRTATDRPLAHATLRVRRLIEDGQDVADRLEEIAFDGVIDASERTDFMEALDFLRKLEGYIAEISVFLSYVDGNSDEGEENASCEMVVRLLEKRWKQYMS